MRMHLLPIALTTALLAACSDEAPPPTGAPPVAETAVDAVPVTPAPATSVPQADQPGTTPPAPGPDGEDAQASFTGYGDLTFGMPASAMATAWGGELKELGKADNASCYFMTPTSVEIPSEFNFMVGDGKFARFGTESARYRAPGGGKVGMTKAEIATLYAGRIEERPHEYTDGQYLRIEDAAGGNGVLVFETDAKGDAAKVTEWRVGVPPEVDYVEGCA